MRDGYSNLRYERALNRDKTKIELGIIAGTSTSLWSGNWMQDVSTCVLTITLPMKIVSHIDNSNLGVQRELCWLLVVRELLSRYSEYKLTRQRSRGTVHASKDAILWGMCVAQS
jgi:hypothetical protein